MQRFNRGWVLILVGIPALTACRRSGDVGASDTIATMVENAAADTAQPSSPLGDGNILAMLDRASVIDSAAASIAVTKATSSDLRNYARQMIRDHHLLRVEAERVARRLRITPELLPGDESDAEMTAMLGLLHETVRGSDFDKAYVDHEVAFHLDVLEVAVTSMELARESEVRAFIQMLAPMLRDHLDRAQALQARLK